ncbi:MAG TPA: PQQ-dependent sugar dehydrogenase [Puia sp.]|nr:PQQ-dependent sugar dehydrogenase [Puia sp.]
MTVLISACGGGSGASGAGIATDSTSIAHGKVVFNRNCSGCHNFKQDDIGPQLGGLTTKLSADWIKRFIKNPREVIASGDEQARQLHDRYKTVMPSFASLDNGDLNAILAFLNTHQAAGPGDTAADDHAIANPISDTIPFSNLVADLEPLTRMPPSNATAPLTRITKLSYQPDTHDLFLVDLRGKLYKLKGDNPQVYLDIKKLRPKFMYEPGLATGFGSFAFHPDFAHNGLLYTTHTEVAGSGKSDFTYPDSIQVTLQFVLTEWKTDHPEADTFSGTGRELLRINMVTQIHGVQEITFNPLSKPGNEDYGLLYIGVGDGGCVEEGYPFILRGEKSIWGTVLRINPLGRNSANGQYGIPPTNPFVKNQSAGALGEIYAYGFRNPQRITWSRSGMMLVCNIGQANIESLYLVQPGHNYGWPVREGNFAFNPNGNLSKVYALPPNDSVYHITYPIAEFDHDDGNAFSGGYEYWGTAIPALKGKFLFGDIPSGKLFYINIADIKPGRLAPIKQWRITINKVPKLLRNVCGSGRVDLHFGRDARGEIYVFTKADGMVYKLASAHQ